jgi:hypothetical protein
VLAASRRNLSYLIRRFRVWRFFFFRQRMNLFAEALKSRFASWPVRETLALDTLHGKHGTFPIIVAESNAVIVAEIKFRQIAVQVLLCTMLVHEDREIAFRGIDAHIAAHVFFGAMLH